MKKCRNCNKDFKPARNRKETTYCTIKCYQDSRAKKYKFDLGQFIFDGACIMAPILILAFAVYCITPKDDLMPAKQNMRKEIELEEIPMSCCDDRFSWDDEDEKFYNQIVSGRKH